MGLDALGISGSPRKDGNTSFLVKEVLKVLEENGFKTEFVSLAGKKIEMCDACYKCKETGICVKEDYLKEVYEKMINSKAIIIGSPTYFASVSAQIKALFDRSLGLRIANYKLKNKVGGALAVGASRNGGQEFVCREIHNWMLLHEMIVVADKKTAHFGAIGVAKYPEEIKNDEIGLETARNLGLKIAEVLWNLYQGKDS